MYEFYNKEGKLVKVTKDIREVFAMQIVHPDYSMVFRKLRLEVHNA